MKNNDGIFKEKRLLFFAGGGLDEYLTDKYPDYVARFDLWDLGDNLNDLRTYASSLGTRDIGIDDLKKYLGERKGRGLNPTETEIEKLLVQRLGPSDPTKRTEAEDMLRVLVEYLNERQKNSRETIAKLEGIKKQKDELPLGLNTPWETTKSTLGSFAEGFKNGTGAEKLTMLAGAAVIALVIRGIYKKSNAARGIIRATVAGGLLVAAASAANKSIERTYGRPLINLTGKGTPFPSIMETQDEWDKNKYAEELENAWTELENMKINTDDYTDFETNADEKKRYAFALTNILVLPTEQALKIYQTGKNSKQIAERNAPKHPFPSDKLSAHERFTLYEEVLRSLGFLQPDGTVKRDLKKSDLKERLGGHALGHI